LNSFEETYVKTYVFTYVSAIVSYMARRKIQDRNVRALKKVRSTYYVSIPIEIIRELRWQEHQKVVVRKQGKNRIVIVDWE
jgi:cell division protein FtsI/penicillin-binding protein 2